MREREKQVAFWRSLVCKLVPRLLLSTEHLKIYEKSSPLMRREGIMQEASVPAGVTCPGRSCTSGWPISNKTSFLSFLSFSLISPWMIGGSRVANIWHYVCGLHCQEQAAPDQTTVSHLSLILVWPCVEVDFRPGKSTLFWSTLGSVAWCF